MSSPGPGRWNLLPLHLDTVEYPDWHPRAGEFGPVYAYVVENDQHLLLVDTGIGPPHELIDRLYRPERRDLVLALAQNNGIEAGDIDAIVLSHLHFDHIGGAHAFPGTPIYVQRAEWEAAQAPKYTVPEFLNFPDANFVLLDGEAEIAPGFRIVPTPGHTPGHQCVALDTPIGTVVLAGQAFETAAELRAAASSPGPDEDARRILDLNPARVWFSHDHNTWPD